MWQMTQGETMKVETEKSGGMPLMHHLQMTVIIVVLITLQWITVDSQLSDQERTPRITKEIQVLQKQNSYELNVGTTPFFTIEAQGTRPLHYVWSRDGVVIQNDTSSFLTINQVQLSDSGSYRCLVYNKFGAARSLPFSLIVKEMGLWPTSEPDKPVQVEERKYALLTMPDISYINDPSFFRITWERNDQTIPSDDPNTYVALDYSLAILNVPQSFDGSRFRVKLMHIIQLAGVEETFSNAFVLSVSASSSPGAFMKPEFVIPPEDVQAVVGSDAKIECVVSGQPFNNLQIVWFKGDDATRIPTGGDSHLSLSSDNRVLTVTSVSASDAGIYGCEGTVTGQAGSVKHQANLTVLIPPAISNQPSSLIVKDFRESLILNCEANGFPTPQVQWYFNGALLLKGSSDSNSRYKIQPNNSLTIESVDLPDSGVYQCFTKNSAGEDNTYTELSVNSAPPTITQAPVDKTVAEHEDTGFTCQVSGGPRPYIYWTKDGVNVTVGGRIRITQQELLIGRTELTDSGLYSCHAVNIKGSVSVEATLVVVIKTQIIHPPQNKSRILTTDARMECGVRSDPTITPTWTWFFTPSYATVARPITEVPGSKEILDDGTLVLYSIIGEDSGLYECQVTSVGGDDRRQAVLNVIELPSPPQITSVALNDDLPNSVKIDWTQSYDGHTPILKFIMQSRLESFSTGSTAESVWETIDSNVSPALRSIVIEDLQPSKFYRFRMIAVNRVNESVPSEPAPRQAIKMPAQPPSEPPRNLYCKQDGERRISVQWEPPPTSSWNGDLQGYFIYYKVKNLGEEKRVNVSGGDTRQTTIGFLAFNMQYRVIVAAYNEKGAGARSKAYFVTTVEGRPSAPPSNVKLSSPNSTTIKVEWDPPDSRLLNGNNQGYDIDVYQGDRLKRVEDFRYDDSNPTGRQTHYITNLLKYTNYTIQIACKTAPGPGPKSPPESIRTLEDVPGPVTNLRIESTSQQNMYFTWEPPEDLNGEITMYEIVHQKKDGTAPPVTETRSSDARSHTLLGLVYDSVYNISVRARTRVGFGPAVVTEFSSAEPPQEPHPPTQLAVTNFEARSVLLQFRPGFDGKATITSWIVQAQVGEDRDWKEIFTISAPDADEILVKNLRPYTYYRLRILAENVFAKSEPSEPCNRFQTQQAIPGAAPEEVTPRAISPTAIRVRWRQVPRSEWNGDFLGYKILYRRWSTDFDLNNTSPAELNLVRERAWTTVTLRNGSNIQGHTLSGLEEWMQYQVKMKAYNAVGNGAESELRTERTSEGVPSGSPVKIEPQALAPISIRVTWSPVPILQRNGNIKGYKVKYNARGSQDEKFQVVEGADIMETTLSGLRMFVEYDIQVLAYSRIGDGALSSTVTIRTLAGAPGPPVKIWFPEVSENEVTIVWEQPDEPNGVIRRYKVAWRRADEPDSVMQTNSVDKNVDAPLSHKVSGLDGETTYVFSVTARTQDDWGAEALVEVYTISNRDPPNPPYNVRIGTSEIKARSMDIYWAEGNTNFGPIRNFTIQHRQRGLMVWETVEETVGPGTTSYIVKGLKPNTYYSFRVSATNDLGMSGFSEPSSERKTLQDKPDGAPQNVAIVALTQDSIKITWEAPDFELWNSDFLMGYYVRFRLEREGQQVSDGQSGSGKDDLTWQYFHINNLELVRVGLEPGLKYICSVQAYNFLGGGPWSVGAFTYLEIVKGAKIVVVPALHAKSSLPCSAVTILCPTPEPPPEDTWNGFLLQDFVMFREEGAQEYRETPAIPFGTFTATLQRLAMGVRYEIRVASENQEGRGPPSVLQVFRVGDIAPFDPPRDLQVTNKSSTELLVSWTPPQEESTNGDLIGYKVVYWQAANSTCFKENGMKPEQRSVTETQLVLDRLSPYTLYCTTVEALNIAGEGPATLPKARRTSEDYPSAPSELRFSNITLKELVVLWNQPKSPNGQIQRYRLEYFVTVNDEKSFIAKHTIPGQERQFYVSDLLENQQYTFQLAASTSIGEGNVSESSVITGPQPGSPEAPLQPVIEREQKYLTMTWVNQGQGDSPIYAYQIRYQEMRSRRKRQSSADPWVPIMEISSIQPRAQINLNDLKPSTNYTFRVRAINAQGISPPSPASKVFRTPASLVSKSSQVFHTQWWFLVIVALTGVILILLIITLLCYVEKRRSKGKEMKRSTTATTVMSTPEPEDGGFPSLEMRQSRRSMARNGKIHNNIYARSPPRPSPASVTYSEDIPPPLAGAAAAASIKPPLSEDNSSVLSEKPSNLGDSSEAETSDSDDSSSNSIAKAPVPSSPPPPAFSSHFNRATASNSSSHYPSHHSRFPQNHHPNRSTRSSRSGFSGAGAVGGGGRHSNSSSSNPTPTADLGDGAGVNIRSTSPSWRFQKPSNAYTYTDSEAESSHYAFSLNNGNIVVNNVAGARTPLAGFSSFV